MKFARFLAQTNIKILPVKTFPNGIVFYVKNGRGLLRVWSGSQNNEELCALVFDGIPLIKFHGEGIICPTCEKLISAGYGLNRCTNKEIEEMGQVFNAPFISIQKSFDDLKPLLGLLPTGYYTLSDEVLFPTDGQGNFFWKLSNTPAYNRATCPFYDPNTFRWHEIIPRYLVPTQPPKLFNRDRAEYYRTQNDTRAIAYHFVDSGYLCALLDSHHKATAAALDGKPVKTLLINSFHYQIFPQEKSKKPFISFYNVTVTEDEMIERPEQTRKNLNAGACLSDDEITRYLALKNDDFDSPLPNDLLKTADKYYNVESLAHLEWAGDLSDGRLDRLLTGQFLKEELAEEIESLIVYVAHALYFTDNPRFVEFATAFGKKEQFVHIWYDLFKLLANIKTTPVEDFFVDYLINDEKLRPHITEIVDHYFIEKND